MIRVTQQSRKETMAKLRALATAPDSVAAGVTSKLRRDSESIAAAMKAIHGGHWNVSVDHEACFVLVARDFN